MNNLLPITQTPDWNICFNMLLDDRVSEIISNGPGEFFATISGQRTHIKEIPVTNNETYTKNIEKGLNPHIDSPIEYEPNTFIHEGALKFEAGGKQIRGRCHMVLPPVTETPQVTIAKVSTVLSDVDAIAQAGSMSSEMLAFLKAAMQARLTIVFSGMTGAGKTTMLSAIAKLMPDEDRIGIAEDSPELALTQPNVTYLRSVPWRPGYDPNSIATLAWCVAQFNRMRISRIIVGETRGGEFNAFLTAANSGMEGCLTTLHANTPAQALEKMTNFAIQGGSATTNARMVNSNIASAINIIVQLARRNGKHYISHISEVGNALKQDESAQIPTTTLYEKTANGFTKVGQMGSDLRRTFEDRGVDPTPFLTSQMNQEKPPHGQTAVVQSTRPALNKNRNFSVT